MHLEGEPLASLLALPPGTLEHLLDCARCRLRLRDFIDPEVVEPLGHPLPPSGLGEAILVQATRICADRDREQAQEAAQGAALFDRLMAVEPRERQGILRKTPEFVSQGLVRVLLETGDEATDPNVSHHLGLLALTLLDQLQLPALSVLALCLVAEAQRRRGEIELAGEILKSAALEVESELASSPVRARLCRALASVRKDEGRLDEGLALLARACSLFEEHGEFGELAEARLEEGLIFLEELEHERAFSALRAALPLVEPEAHPRLAVAVLHALALTCADLGRSESLRQVLDALDALRKVQPERLDGVRIRWIRAQVEWRLGNLKPAIERLQRVFSALLEAGAPAAETAAAALELARMHLDKHPVSPPSTYQDLLLALEPLAREGKLAASLWEVSSFALGFAQKGDGFSAEVFDRAIRYLQVAQFNPELPFYPLSDPKEVVSWQELPEEARQAASLSAGVELAGGEPAARRLLAWTHEALSGVRIQFPDLGFDERRPR
jgi:tetratricopeptide (TPR) repeat protein